MPSMQDGRSGTGRRPGPLRIVQVDSFYPSCIAGIYRARRDLTSAPFDVQVGALLGSGFSAAHNIAPHLKTLGYDAHFIVANAQSAQAAWLKEHGLSVPTHDAVHETVRRQVEVLAPDILYLSDMVDFDGRFVRSLARRPPLVMGWHATSIRPGSDWDGFDVVLSGLSGMLEAARRLGARAAEKFMPGFPEWIDDTVGAIEPCHDVVFAGSASAVQHARRNHLLARLGQAAARDGFDCAFHLLAPPDTLPFDVSRWQRREVFGLDMHRALGSARIVFDARSSMLASEPDGTVRDLAGDETANMRLFEATGAGALLLTEQRSNLSDYFRVGEEIETFSSEGELLEKVRHYLDHPEERAAMARKGRHRCLADHGMRLRVHDFDAIVRRHLPAAASTLAAWKPVLPPENSGAAGPIRHFCTYFDSAYAARGLAMIASILRFLPEARIHVLCLDETAHRILSEQPPAVRPVRLSELEAFDPALADCRANRSRVEYYFTCTPCLPRYVMRTQEGVDLVTYLDADLFFFTTPEAIFDEIGGASVAIVPHRFSPPNVRLMDYGIFNVAWVSWRNDPVGRRCLEDYRADCIAWCFDRLDGDRFADQRYLDKWPARYPTLHVLGHKGANLALWNCDNYSLREEEGRIWVDEMPLVFFHFHGVTHTAPGVWDTRQSWYRVRHNLPLINEVLYKPYLALVEREFDRLASLYGMTIPGNRRYTDGDGGSSRPVPVSDGYAITSRKAAAGIMNDAWTLADVGRLQEDAYRPLLDGMRAGSPRIDLAVAAEAVHATGLSKPTLLDVGCASGYYADVFNHLLETAPHYSGVDRSPALIDLAKTLRPERSFQVADATALPFPDASVDIVFNGVALMHIVDYEAAIAESRRVARRFCIFHTVPLTARRPTTFLHKRAYGHQVAEVILNEGELRLLLTRHGLAVCGVWDSVPYDLSPLLGEATPTRTFLCEVTERRPADPALLNIGCGNHFHRSWVNVDVAPCAPAVMAQNVAETPLSFADAVFDAVYHSHVLEHLPKQAALPFLRDCLRVLKPGGVLRVAVPDLERISREYLRWLDEADEDRPEAVDRYDWIVLELLDQMVRNESGGEMKRHLQRDPLPAQDYIVGRIGDEAMAAIGQARQGDAAFSASFPRIPAAEEIGRFRKAGEAHQWMYDRFSLRRLLEAAGFTGCRLVGARESDIPDFASYELDANAHGVVRKPDSLFMEARKPMA